MNHPAPSPAFIIAYVVVGSALALGQFVLYRRHPEPAFRIQWHTRLTLLSFVTVLAFMIAAFPPFAIIAVPFAGIMYLQMSKSTICKSCGKVIQPIGAFRSAKYCPHCGGETARSPLFPAKNKDVNSGE